MHCIIFIFWKINGLTAEENNGLGKYDIGFHNKKEENECVLIELKVYKTKKEENDENNKKKKINDQIKSTTTDAEIENYLHKECVDAIN